tara:strand:- start:3093 stop:4481 length:1389 start_codon:yes stop_codon:yes gene_type:complete
VFHRIFFLFVVLFIGIQNAAAEWKAAAAKLNMTPTEPMWMSGYSSRKTPGSGKTTEIYAKVLLLEDERKTRLVTITFDLVGVPQPFRLELSSAVDKQFGIRPANLFLNASHTHSGPMVRLVPPFRPGGKTRPAYANIPENEIDKYVGLTQAYLAKLQSDLLDEIAGCIKRLEPAKVQYSIGRCGFAMNRRLIMPTRILNSPNPDGPVDHDVPVLQVRNAKKELLAILFGYACHNTVLSYMTFSGDYAGWAQQYLEEDHPGAIALFVTGCGADQNPYPRRIPHWAPRHGRSLANAVEAGLIANPQTVSSSISTGLEYIDLVYDKPPTREDLEKKAKSSNPYDRRHGKMSLEYLEATGSLKTKHSYPVQAIRLGEDLTMITLGGEVVVDYSLRLKRELKGDVWVAGYSNDLVGYVPSERVLKEGGYEGGGAMRFVRGIPHPGPWAPGIEEHIVGTVHKLVKGLE